MYCLYIYPLEKSPSNFNKSKMSDLALVSFFFFLDFKHKLHSSCLKRRVKA